MPSSSMTFSMGESIPSGRLRVLSHRPAASRAPWDPLRVDAGIGSGHILSNRQSQWLDLLEDHSEELIKLLWLKAAGSHH